MSAARLSANEYAELTALVKTGSTDAVVDWLQACGWADPRMVRAMLAAAGGHLLVTPVNYRDRRTVLTVEPRPGIGGIAMKIREPS